MSLMEIEEPLRRSAALEPSAVPLEDDGFLRSNSMGAPRPSAGREEAASVVASSVAQPSMEDDDGFVRVSRGASPRTGEDLLQHMRPREPGPGGVRGFLHDHFTANGRGTGGARQLARFGMGMNAESTAGVPGLIGGQVAMNGLDVAEAGASLGLVGGSGAYTGGLTGTMRRDIGRTAGIALTAAARKAIHDTGERSEDIAVDTRARLAQEMAHRKALIERRRAGDVVPRNDIGRSLVHTWAASTRHGANVEHMGHRPEFGYTMQQSAAINNRRAVREKGVEDGAVRFVDRAAGTELTQPGQQPGDAPISQTAAERRRGARHQNLAAITRGGDELGRILQNDEGGLDDLYQGNYGKAMLKGTLNTARNIGVGIGANALDPTGGYVGYPVLDAGLRIAGAGVSAASQAVGHATGIEAKAQLQDDKDLYNRHYFGDRKAAARPLEGFDTARQEQILRHGLRERGHADEIGSERAGLPQLSTGNAATSFLGQRLGRGTWTRWWRDAVTEPRAVGQIVTPAARSIGSGLAAAGKFAAKYTGLSFLARKARMAFSPSYRERQRAKDAERDALIAPESAADPGAAQAPSLADVLAPQDPVQQQADPVPGEDEKEVDLLQQIQDAEREPDEPLRSAASSSASGPRSLGLWQPGDPEPPARRSVAESSRAGTVPPPEARENRVGRLLEEEPAGGESSEADEEMLRLAAERQGRAEIADEDALLRRRLAKETKAKDTFMRNYVVGETLGFGKFDKAQHNISAWMSHFRDRDLRTGQNAHARARRKDPVGYERNRQAELERIRQRLRGMPGMAERMDREEAVRSGDTSSSARRGGDLGSEFDVEEILQRYGPQVSSDLSSESSDPEVDSSSDPASDALSDTLSEATDRASVAGAFAEEGFPEAWAGEEESEEEKVPDVVAQAGAARAPAFFASPEPMTPITQEGPVDHPASRPFGFTPESEAEWRRDLRRRR